MRIFILTTTFFLTLTAVAFAQGSSPSPTPIPAVRGKGTVNTISKFTDNRTIGDSGLVEADGTLTTSDNINASQVIGTIDVPGHALVGTNVTTEGDTGQDKADGSISGVRAVTFSPAGTSVFAINNSSSGDPVAVRALTNSNDRGIAVRGSATHNQGLGIGVLGEAGSPQGVGVIGNNVGGGVAVLGNAARVGVLGVSLATSGFTEPISGLSTSPDGAAAVFRNRAGGQLIVGQGVNDAEKFRVDGNGNVFATGSINAFSPYADVAERIDATEVLAAGDVVEIDPAAPGHFRKVRSAYSTLVAGIVSSAPAITLANRSSTDMNSGLQDHRPALALAGRVPVNVTAEGGEIRVGDLLTSSSVRGYAMRCADQVRCVGAIVAKALEASKNERGTILALATLQ